MNFKITVNGLENMVRNSNRVKEIANEVYAKTMQDVIDRTIQIAKSNVPVVSGTLKDSITGELTSGGMAGVISVGAPYAAAVEGGAKAHPIDPVKATALAFHWPAFALTGRSDMVFLRHVNHPGFKGRFFMADTATQIMPFIQDQFSKALLKSVDNIFNL